MLARAGLPSNMTFAITLSFSFFVGDVFIPLGLTELRGTNAVTAGSVLTAGVLGWTLGAWLPVKLPATSWRRLAATGAALVTAGVLGAGIVLATGVPLAFAGLSWAFAGIGAGLGFTANSHAVLAQANPDRSGLATSQMETSNLLGIALGTGLGGLLLDPRLVGSLITGVASVFLLAIAAGLIALAASRRFPSARTLRPPR